MASAFAKGFGGQVGGHVRAVPNSISNPCRSGFVEVAWICGAQKTVAATGSFSAARVSTLSKSIQKKFAHLPAVRMRSLRDRTSVGCFPDL
jgi:hypothetical protein